MRLRNPTAVVGRAVLAPALSLTTGIGLITAIIGFPWTLGIRIWLDVDDAGLAS